MLAASSDHLRFDTGDDTVIPTIGMAPLVDIVLLLICFYLLVMQSIQSHHDPAVELPSVRHDATVEILPAELVVNLTVDGDITVNSRPVSVEELGDLIASERLRTAGAGQPLKVVVRADRRQRYGELDDILKTAQRAGVATVLLRATDQPRQ